MTKESRNAKNNSLIYGSELNLIKKAFYLIVEYGSKKNCENKKFFIKLNYFKPQFPSETVKNHNFARSVFYKFKSKGKILIPIFPTYMSQEDIFLYFKNLEINSNIFDCIDTVKYAFNNQRNPLFIDMHISHNFNKEKLRLKMN